MDNASSAPEAAAERRTTAVELFWDLVFVFAVTQVTALLAHHTSWARFGQAMLVLALVWWAWSAFVGAVAHGWARVVLWTAAVAIDYAGPAWLTRERLRGLQQVAVAHFAERYGAFVIICLGESIVALGAGVGRAERQLTPGLVIGSVLALLIVVGMWWTYFDRIAESAQERLREHRDPVLAAADAYSYMHLIIVAGIIILAGGVKLVAQDSVSAPMPDAGRLAMCAGAATYLTGLAAFRLRMLGERSYGRLLTAVALMVLYLVSGGFPAWVVGALIAALLAVLCGVEVALGAAERAESAPAVRPAPPGAERAG